MTWMLIEWQNNLFGSGVSVTKFGNSERAMVLLDTVLVSGLRAHRHGIGEGKRVHVKAGVMPLLTIPARTAIGVCGGVPPLSLTAVNLGLGGRSLLGHSLANMMDIPKPIL